MLTENLKISLRQIVKFFACFNPLTMIEKIEKIVTANFRDFFFEFN